MRLRAQSRGQDDLFRSRLDQMINMRHELPRLAGLIDWPLIETKLGDMYTDAPGQPPLPTRLMAGLALLKHMHNLSDEELVARWIENPYYQHFCGEEHFRHEAPFDRSSMTRWRQRMGDERLEVLLQESLTIAIKTEAMEVKDLSKVIVDTTVQEKAMTFPTDAKLLNRARVMLVKLANKHGLKLRQGYPKVGKLALMKYQRYAHAKQFKRARRAVAQPENISGPGDPRHRSPSAIIAVTRTRSSGQSCSWHNACTRRSAANAAQRFIRSMRRKSNASAKARRTSLTSSASKSRWRRRSSPRAADSSCWRRRRCRASLTTATRWRR